MVRNPDADNDGMCDAQDMHCNLDGVMLRCRRQAPECLMGMVPAVEGGCYTNEWSRAVCAGEGDDTIDRVFYAEVGLNVHAVNSAISQSTRAVAQQISLDGVHRAQSSAIEFETRCVDATTWITRTHVWRIELESPFSIQGRVSTGLSGQPPAGWCLL